MDLLFGAFAVMCLIPSTTCAIPICVEGCHALAPIPNGTVEDGVSDGGVLFPSRTLRSITTHTTTQAPITNSELFMEDLYPTSADMVYDEDDTTTPELSSTTVTTSRLTSPKPTTRSTTSPTARTKTTTNSRSSPVSSSTTTSNVIDTCVPPCRQAFSTCLKSAKGHYCGCQAGYFEIKTSHDEESFQCGKPVLLKQKFGLPYKEEYANTSSLEFQRISKNITKILISALGQISSTVNVKKITQGSVVVWYETATADGREISRKDIQSFHDMAVQSNNYGLGNISVEAPEIVTIPDTCLPEKIKPHATNMPPSWNFVESKPGDWVRSKENCEDDNHSATIRCINGSYGARYDRSSLEEINCSVTWESVVKYENGVQLTEQELTDFMTTMTTLSSKYEKSTANDVDKFIDLYHDISQNVEQNEVKVSELAMYNIIWATDNLRKAVYHRATTVGDQLEKAESTKLIRSLEIFADNIVLTQNLLDIASWSVKFLAQNVDGRSSVNFTDAPDSTSKGNRRNITARVPRSAFGTPTNASRNAVFFLHKDTTLFPNSDSENAELSEVLSIQITNTTLQNLSDPINISFSLSRQISDTNEVEVSSASASGCSYTTQRCTFLDVETGNWKYRGCVTQYGDMPEYVTCSCNHATNFAVLVKTNNVKNSYILDIVGEIGCTLSIIGLLFTIFTYLYFRSLRKNKLNQIHLHLCASLLVGYLTFLTGVERPRAYVPCLVVTAVLQFSFLAAWGWMITEFYVMYRKFIRVFEDIHGRFVFKASILVYAASLTTTAITFVVAFIVGDTVDGWIPSKDNDPLCWKSSYVGDRLCWLHSYALYFGFLVPVGIMFAINFVGFIVVMHKINRKRPNLGRQAGKDPELKNQLIRVFLISSLLGVTWMFAVPLTLSEDEIVNETFSWLFSIGNAFQGIIFFTLFCLRRNNVKQLWIAQFGVCCKYDIMKKSQSATSSTYETGGTLPSTALSQSTIGVKKDEIDMASLQSG